MSVQVRADPAVAFRRLVTQLKSQTEVPVYTAEEGTKEGVDLWARVLSFEFNPMPRAGGDGSGDEVDVVIMVGISIDPGRIVDDGAYAPAAAAAAIQAALDEFSSGTSDAPHRLEMGRASVQIAGPEDEVTELVLAVVTCSGTVYRDSGITMEDHVS